MSVAFQTIGEPQVLRSRGSYLPAWTPKFTDADLDNEVKVGNRGLGFKIRDMLPERRWAVAPDGEVMAQRDFEDKFAQWNINVIEKGEIIPIAARNEYFDPKLIPVPTVERFVSTGNDFQGKEVPIGFDPNKPPSGQASVAPKADESADTMAKLRWLSELRTKGLLTDEQLASEMSLVLAPPTQPAPPPGFDVVTEAVEEAPLLARCGREVKSPAGRAAHERNCDDCKAAGSE